MNRKYFYWGLSTIIYIAAAWIIAKFFTHDILGGIFCAIPFILIGPFIAALIDGILSPTHPGFLYTPYKDKRQKAVERRRKREAEAYQKLKILENELLNPYSSLSYKYKLISDFCFDHPHLNKRLKETKSYIIWRGDVIDWAKDNLDRLKSFYLCDGLVDYAYESSQKSQGLVNLMEKYKNIQNPNYSVICDIEIRKKRVPKDYFESQSLVWEDEEIDPTDYSDRKSRGTAAEAVSLGVGLGAGLGIFGNDNSNFGSGNDGCGCGSST